MNMNLVVPCWTIFCVASNSETSDRKPDHRTGQPIWKVDISYKAAIR